MVRPDPARRNAADSPLPSSPAAVAALSAAPAPASAVSPAASTAIFPIAAAAEMPATQPWSAAAEMTAQPPAAKPATAPDLPGPQRREKPPIGGPVPAPPTETSHALLQTPDLVLSAEAPETAGGRAVESPAVSSGSGPVIAPDADVRRAVVDQLLATVRATSTGTVEIMLSPEELGQVRLDMKMVDGVMTVRIDADRPETLDLMRRGADVLFRELRDAGFGALNLSFGSGTPQRGSFPSSGGIAGRHEGDANLEIQAATAPAGAARGLGSARLDIRI